MIRTFGSAFAALVFAIGLFAEPSQVPQRFTSPFSIGTASQSVQLRAMHGNPVAAASRGPSAVYSGAYRGVDVTRTLRDGTGEERMLLTDPHGPRTFEYDVVSMRGIAVAAADGRGVRFAGRDPREASIVISAPAVVDRDGKSSHRAWWEISADRSGAPTALRLRIDDPLLAYPISIRSAIAVEQPGRTIEPAPRPRLVQTTATTGSISGTLLDASTGAPIAFELVHAYDTSAQWVASGVSNAGGLYTISDLAPATYYVLAVPYTYEYELYSEKPCPGGACTITTGDPVAVAANATTGGINFTLDSRFARIAGTVTDAVSSNPLPGVSVIAYDTSGNWAGSAFADSSGDYTISLDAAGTYFARTANYTYSGYVDQLYNGIHCTGCDPLTGTGIAANLSSVTPGIDFALAPNGGRISGKLLDGATGDPIPFEYVFVHNSAGAGVTYGQTDAAGNYTTFNGLASGNYYVYTTPAGYTGEVYDNQPCPGLCNPTSGTPVAVTLGSNTAGIDFTLGSNVTRIAGRVTDEGTSAGISSVPVGLYDASGSLLDYGFTDVNGNYTIPLSGGGTFYARTFASSSYAQYIDELYDDIPCLACNVTTGTAINATTGSTTSGIDFALSSNGGSISGRVTDTLASPIEGALVSIYDSAGNEVTYGFSDSNGDYTSTQALAPGTYYLVTSPFGYAGELYDNFPCPNGGCIVTGGTGVVVNAGQNTANIDFALTSALGRITGTVVDETNNLPVMDVDVQLFNASGNFILSTSVSPSGTYELYTDTGGTYYVKTLSLTGVYGDELYDDIPCSACNVTTGTPISVTVGSVTPNIDFVLPVIACPTITVSPFTLPGGTVGDSYNQAVIATGGEDPYTYEVGGGSLPTGLTLDMNNGGISGTLTSAGSFSFSILATDANGCVGGRSYIIDVTDSAPTITNVSPASGPTAGGTTVTITGTNLSTVSSVLFGSTAAGIVSVTATSIDVDSPPHATGTVDVTVTTSGGSATAVNAFTYLAPTTTVTLTSSLNPSTFGDSVTFTATLGDDGATGTVSFYDDATLLGTSSVNTGIATFTTSSLSAGAHPITAVYGGDSTYGTSTSNTVVQQVDKIARTITLTVSPSGSSTYGDPVTLTATLSPADEATSVDFYDGATLLGSAAVAGNTATFITSALNAGNHSLTASTAETATYFAATSNAVAHTVNKATPVFSNLTSPTIVVGTPGAILGGTLTAGTLVPTGSVTITVGSSSAAAPIDGSGDFGALLATGSLAVGTHPISFTYAGDANFNSASGSATLTVTFGFTVTFEVAPKRAPATMPLRIRLVDANGNNVSTETIVLTAYGFRLQSSATWLAPNPTGALQFQNANGGQYKYNLKTTGLAPGDYVFGFTVAGDPVIHEIPFTVH